jgi:hypothetical protein
MGAFCRLAVVCLAVVALTSSAQAKQGTEPRTQVYMTAMLQALQTAVDNKDSTAIFNILNSVPGDQRGPLSTLLLIAAQNVQDADEPFAATFVTLAYVSGGLTTAQTTIAIDVVRNAPSGLAIVNTLLSSNVTDGFGFGTTSTSGLLIANLGFRGESESNPSQFELTGPWGESGKNLRLIWGGYD